MGSVRAGRLPRFDSRDPAVLDDPYGVYASLRAQGPLCRGGPGQWVVTRHAEVSALLKDRRLSAAYPEEYHRLSVGDGPAVSFFSRIMLDRDPPDHTRIRRLTGAAFTPALVRTLTDHIGVLVDGLLAPARETGRLDAVSDLAFPLPVLVICELLGIPAADRDLVRPRVSDLARGFALKVSPPDRAATHAAVAWLREHIGALVDRKRKEPGHDLLSTMVAVRAEGERLSAEEIVDNAIFLFFAGFETTMNLIATGCHALAGHPGEFARLRREPGLVETAVEEFLRYDAPIQAAARMVREPIEIGGRTVRGGRLLVLLLGSANHDERRFRDPGRLDVGRAENPHVSFGGGIHHCLGAVLARIEGRVVFSRLLASFGGIELDGPPVRRRSTTFRSFERLPLALVRRKGTAMNASTVAVPEAGRVEAAYPPPDELAAMAALARVGDYVTPLALRAMVNLGVPDHLAAGPRSADELAERVGADAPSLLRVLRALSGSGVFREVTPGTFELTPMSQLLRRDHPHSMRGLYQLSPVDIHAWAEFEVSVRTSGSGFQQVHGHDFWTHVEEDPDYRAVFEADMWDMTERELAVVRFAYDLSSVGTLVDVGGGNGQFLAGLLQANPAMKGVLFDLPHVAPKALPWLEETGVASRCTIVAGDFFDEVPAGGDAYLLKRVFYDFTDDQVVAILGNVRAAMNPAGRVLVLDGMVRPDNRWDTGKIHDLYVLGMGQGRCRSRDEMKALFQRAGLALRRVVPTGIFPIVEARVA